MPGVVTDPPCAGAKLITVMPDNVRSGRPVIQGIIVLLDTTTGAVGGLVEGQTLTALRTGAVSGLATDLLAREDSKQLAMIGSGPQADTQVEAVCCVRPIDRVVVYSRTREHAEALGIRLRERARVKREIEIVVSDSVESAVKEADVICTATRATQPILLSDHVRAGTHVNAVGSYTLEMQELDVNLLGRARVVVDDREAAMSEAGELVLAVRAGAISLGQMASLGELVTGVSIGRTDHRQITVFKSVGLAVQDLCAAARALDRAERTGVGTVLHF
jgi:ornithine cyclodeaminase